MSENIIFCYSGSGNCLDIAKNIAKELGDTDIVMMRREPKLKNALRAKTVGFVFPCYGGGLPGDYEKWVKNLMVGYNAYTYGVVSYAGYKGVGLSKVNKIIPLNYWNGISHNCSCIWLFPHNLMLPVMPTKKAQERSEALAKQIAADVKNRVQTEKNVPKNVLNAVESAVWPKLAVKKAADFSVNIQKCIGCGQCEKLCPKGNISLVNGVPAFGSNCIQCLSCLQYCPKEAIDVGQPAKRSRYHNANVTAEELMQDVIHID